MRLVFCFSRSCRPYPTTLALRSLPCWPGAKLRFSTGHLSVKHLAPFKNSFMPSRRQRRQTAPLYLAIFLLYFECRWVYREAVSFLPIQLIAPSLQLLASRKTLLTTLPAAKSWQLKSHTLRRFGGRHPLCGMGVMSRMVFTSRPAAASARMADSRPDPGPFTRTSTERIP